MGRSPLSKSALSAAAAVQNEILSAAGKNARARAPSRSTKFGRAEIGAENRGAQIEEEEEGAAKRRQRCALEAARGIGIEDDAACKCTRTNS